MWATGGMRGWVALICIAAGARETVGGGVDQVSVCGFNIQVFGKHKRKALQSGIPFVRLGTTSDQLRFASTFSQQTLRQLFARNLAKRAIRVGN